MNDLSRAFRRRLVVLVVCLTFAVVLCLVLAVLVQREARDKLSQMTHVELEATSLARHFRSTVDELHGELLRLGSDQGDDGAAVIERYRAELTRWITARRTEGNREEEQKIVRKIATEIQSYFAALDALAHRPNGMTTPLDRDTIVMFDDAANRLQSMADDFASAHDERLRELLQTSLSSLQWMRNLVFVCLVLLLAAVAVVVMFIYRDVVLPLREQLVNSKSLLAQREKLAALGTLAAGVAHEIRNPLTAIKARLYTLRRVAVSPSASEDLHAIAAEVDRLEKIVRDVLGYAQPVDAAFSEVELASWLQEFATFVRPDLADDGIRLGVNAEGPLKVRIDANQLRQVVLNLVRNAQEAFEGRTGFIELSLNRERRELRGAMTEVAVLSVVDNGPGVPLKLQSRLFDPFFTTKPTGTGLGLSIVARLVENQGGEIAFQSAPGTGMRFTLHLPIREPAAKSPRS